MDQDIDSGMDAALARMLTTLEAKVDPQHTGVLVVDMQNDFCAKGGYWDKQKRDLTPVQVMAPRFLRTIAKAREVGVPIIFIQSIYNAPGNPYLSDVWLEQVSRRVKGPYLEYSVCGQNSWGSEFYEGFKPLAGDIIVKKHRFSAFINTDLALILRSKGIRTLVVGGVATHICVETTIRDGFLNDFYMVLLGDCSATVSKELQENTLKIVDNWFGQVTSSDEVIRVWSQKRK